MTEMGVDGIDCPVNLPFKADRVIMGLAFYILDKLKLTNDRDE